MNNRNSLDRPVPEWYDFIKLNPSQTVEAEIKVMMPSQRACVAESQVRNKSSNGPLRAQSNAKRKVFCDVGHTSVAGDMMVSREARDREGREYGWHRGNLV